MPDRIITAAAAQTLQDEANEARELLTWIVMEGEGDHPEKLLARPVTAGTGALPYVLVAGATGRSGVGGWLHAGQGVEAAGSGTAGAGGVVWRSHRPGGQFVSSGIGYSVIAWRAITPRPLGETFLTAEPRGGFCADSQEEAMRKRTMMLLLALMSVLPLLGACHTTAGAGEDISATGKAVTKGAQHLTPNSP